MKIKFIFRLGLGLKAFFFIQFHQGYVMSYTLYIVFLLPKDTVPSREQYVIALSLCDMRYDTLSFYITRKTAVSIFI